MPTNWPSEEWPLPDSSDETIFWTVFESPEMWPQIMHAQATFLEFARHAELERFRIVKTYEEVAIKAFFEDPARKNRGEHIFLTDVFTDGKSITATLAASPTFRCELKEGQEVTFPRGRLSDWFLVRGGTGIGGFTLPVIWDGLSRDQRTAYANEPPFAWFSHRTIRPEEELAALPRCSKCGRRNLDDPENADPLCRICASGGWRCECPQCGAPLIRFPNAPSECCRCLAAAESE